VPPSVLNAHQLWHSSTGTPPADFAMSTIGQQQFFDPHALIGGYQKTKAVRYTFDGRRLICRPTWRARLFYPIVASFILFGLGWMLFGIYREGLSDGLQRGEKIAIGVAALFIPLLLLQYVWAIRYERSFVWDFVGQSIEITRRDFGRRRRLEMSASEIHSVETTVIQRLRGQKQTSGTIDCHCLNLVTGEGSVLPLLETTDPQLVESVAEIIRQHATLPASVR
jgi:hypothetical protein